MDIFGKTIKVTMAFNEEMSLWVYSHVYFNNSNVKKKIIGQFVLIVLFIKDIRSDFSTD
jgi:hypothetical protein